jgi:hypothetical protein
MLDGKGADMADDTLVGDMTEQEPVEPQVDNVDDEGDDVDDVQPIPFYGLAAPTGTNPDDPRGPFGVRALTWRTLPIPLTFQYETAPGHEKAVTIGAIEDMWYDENNFIAYKGHFLDPTLEPYVDKVIGGIAMGAFRGVSVDVVAAQYELPPVPPEFESVAEARDYMIDLVQNPPRSPMTAGKVAGLCVVGIPAFEDTYIRIGECDCPDQGANDATHMDEEPDTDPEYSEMTEDQRAEESALTEAFAQGVLDMIETDTEVAAFADALGETDRPIVNAMVAAAFAPGTHDGPGWITHPVATSRIRRYWVSGKGAAKIKWGAPNDFYRCRGQLRKYVQNPDWLSGLCANMHKEALGVWPGQEAGGGNHGHGSLLAAAFPDQEFDMSPAAPYNIVASAASPNLPPTDWFRDPGLTGPTALQVTDDGRVFGHVATWNVCHIGIQGKCQTAPRSASGYAYYKTGIARTTEGDVAVGHITMGTGHAPLNVRGFAAAAHYDNTGAVVADVAAGEDQYGIWVAGALRGNVTDEQKVALRGAALSGDWRTIQGSKEMVAALAVNVPGFPIPRTEALVASGEEALVAAALVPQEGQEQVSYAEQGVNAVIEGLDPKQFALDVMSEMDRQKRIKEARGAYAAATRDDIFAAALAVLEED